ncbi:hypothetical protein [Candidatus Magnetobacterium casense]|uniref:Uncharacterized protein n=1 Tax=Candidatus Magnetobacterium casense TaxID=1455061 RepID=A0ABS6S4J3_9BACT|nr:hypothetical protein [Candidatus Magnetobacterium casensis]MBV6343567.1 hypothetical protein [Candidatus Magnetobacterium casensis]
MVASAAEYEGFTQKEMLVTMLHKLDDLSDCTNELKTQSARNADRISSLDGDMNRHETLIHELDEKVNGVNMKSNIWDGLNSTVNVILAALIGTKT